MKPKLYKNTRFSEIPEYIKHVQNTIPNSVQQPLVAQPGLAYPKKAISATKILPVFKKYNKTNTEEPKMRNMNTQVTPCQGRAWPTARSTSNESWRAQDSIALRGPFKEDKETAHPRIDVMPHSRRLDQACWKHHLWEFDRNREHQPAPNMQLPMDAYCVMNIVWLAGSKQVLLGATGTKSGAYQGKIRQTNWAIFQELCMVIEFIRFIIVLNG